MDKWIWIFLVFISGALLPIQAGMNARMGKELASPFWSSFISFAVGAIALGLYSLLTKAPLKWEQAAHAPGYTWWAGILGGAYVTIVALGFQKIGPALSFGLIVCGQLVISMLLEHQNILVAQQHSFNTYRLLGLLLILAGVIIIRKY